MLSEIHINCNSYGNVFSRRICEPDVGELEMAEGGLRRDEAISTQPINFRSSAKHILLFMPDE